LTVNLRGLVVVASVPPVPCAPPPVVPAAARGEPLEQVRKSVNLDEFHKQFAGDSRVRRDIFDSYVLGAGLAAAYADATAKP
jgi:hypothetical protein